MEAFVFKRCEEQVASEYCPRVMKNLLTRTITIMTCLACTICFVCLWVDNFQSAHEQNLEFTAGNTFHVVEMRTPDDKDQFWFLFYIWMQAVTQALCLTLRVTPLWLLPEPFRSSVIQGACKQLGFKLLRDCPITFTTYMESCVVLQTLFSVQRVPGSCSLSPPPWLGRW